MYKDLEEETTAEPPQRTLVKSISVGAFAIRFAKVWPGGNTTALVRTRVPRSLYSEIARTILQQDKSIEQVGFIESPSSPRALIRLQMMGGEFCGNATRSIAYFLYESLQKQNGNAPKQFMVEVSGSDQLIPCSIEDKCVEIGLPVDHYTSDLFRTCKDGTLVKLDGIQHFVTDFPAFAAFQPGFLKLRAHYILRHEGLLRNDILAAGVIFMQKMKEGIKLHPVIWVQETGTFIYETSCASGTLAVALHMARDVKEGKEVNSLMQPSGMSLRTTVTKKDGKFSKVLICGEVETKESNIIYFTAPQHARDIFSQRLSFNTVLI